VKTYDVPHRGPHCPTGRHAADDPVDESGEPLQPDEAARQRRFNEVCDCAWLKVASTTPEPHITTWNRRELENIIKEMDKGHFDPQHFPPRNNASRFMSPTRQRLLELLDADDPIGAVRHLLTGIEFDRVAWDPESACLSLRRRAYGRTEDEWLQLHLGAEAGRYTASGPKPGGNPETIVGVWEEAPAEQLAARAEAKALIDGSRRQITGQVASLLELDNPTLIRSALPGRDPGDDLGWVDIPLPGFDELRGDDDGS
jgi:hypothetical protein